MQQVDGTELSFKLSCNPVITVKGNDLEVATTTQQIKIPIEAIKEYRFSDSPTVIKPTMQLNDYIIGIYSIDGKKVSVDTSASIDLSSLSKGIYIIKTKTKVYKVINK